MKYLSLFSGIGGFELGIGTRAECIGFSEINPYSISIYEHHFPSHRNFGDIRKIDPKELPPFDLLVGGFPCQAFSIAGRRRGSMITEERSFLRSYGLSGRQSLAFCSLRTSRAWSTTREGKPLPLSSAHWMKWGMTASGRCLTARISGCRRAGSACTLSGILEERPDPRYFLSAEKAERVTLPQSPDEEIAGVKIRNASPQGFAVAGVGDSIDLTYPNSTTRMGRVGKNIAHTVLPGMEMYTLTEERRLRRITPIEAERLPGFPDRWTETGVRNGKLVSISDAQRYRCAGNAVSTSVIDTIAQKLTKTHP